MSALSIHLERLLSWLESIGLYPPSKDVRIIEVNTDGSNRGDDGREQVRKDGLRRTSDYEGKFDELLQTGYSWLNLSCYGVYEGFLIVAVEVPSATVPHMAPSGWSPEGRPRALRSGCPTSVNISGPARIVLDHEWSVDSILTIV
jgi:hypothetical protein